jgi:hypothetical protein
MTEPREPLGPEEGGGPPALMPWTLVVDTEDWSADLEHGAPLPAVGDRVEFIADDGTRHDYRVIEVVHTVQSSATERPPVGEEASGPNSTVSGAGDRRPRVIRAGLPRVIVTPEG